MKLDTLSKYAPLGLAVLRVVTALLFIEHGTQKLFDFPASGQAGPAGGLPPLMLVAAAIELIGGLLLLVGLFTRYAAFVMAGEMAVAFWMGHVGGSGSVFPAVNMGDAAVLFCFVFLYLFLAGPGDFSIDGRRTQRA
jgi:putative oxidoreductase